MLKRILSKIKEIVDHLHERSIERAKNRERIEYGAFIRPDWQIEDFERRKNLIDAIDRAIENIVPTDTIIDIETVIGEDIKITIKLPDIREKE